MPELRAAVLGAGGYAGGELLRLLSGHPRVTAVRAFSASHAGRPLAEVHPALRHLPAGRFERPDASEAAAWADVVFLALPHGQSQSVMERILAEGPRLVVDLAADFRIHDAGRYRRVYGEHAAPGLPPSFTYALADALGPRLEGRTRLAVPGCFATAALLALRPLAEAGLLDGPPTVFAVTGSTGAGARPRRTTHHPVRAHNVFAYAREGHRHEAEVAEQLQRWSGGAGLAVRLLTHAAPLVRGIHATVHARLRRPLADPLGLLEEAWAGRPFVRVLPEPPELAAVVGTNFAHLHAVPRAGGREVVVDAVIDNLVKGAAGQAVQAMNLALGLEETAGLGFPGLYPC